MQQSYRNTVRLHSSDPVYRMFSRLNICTLDFTSFVSRRYTMTCMHKKSKPKQNKKNRRETYSLGVSRSDREGEMLRDE